MSDGPATFTVDAEPPAATESSAILPRAGTLAWAFVGCVIALVIVVIALAAVSEIALPLTFAAVLAIIFKPLVATLGRLRLKRGAAAGVIVLGLLALATLTAVATARGLTSQTAEIGASVDAAIDRLVASTDLDPSSLDQVRTALEGTEPAVTGGVLQHLVSGVGALVGVISALILGSLIMYYLLKDGSKLRIALVSKVEPHRQANIDDFIGDSCRTLRAYGQGRTVMSAIVSIVIGIAALILGLPLVFTIMVANFIGGYIPYIGAFIGGGLAVIVALGDGGLGTATIMLVVVLASNLLLENFVEPKVMGRSLDIHPLTVLVVTALGGLVGGIVGLILAVPAFVIAADAIGRMRAGNYLDDVTERAQPTVQRVLG